MGSRIPFAKLDLCLLSLHSYFLSLQSLICTLERSDYVNAQHVKCASINVGFHHSGDIRTFRLDPEIHLKIENANYMRWTNMTYQDTADYNAFMNKAVLPWLYGWMILFENYQTYLYFLGLRTSDSLPLI